MAKSRVTSLNCCGSCFSECAYRYTWLEEYREFRDQLTLKNMGSFMDRWSSDGSPFGGKYTAGAIHMPFGQLVYISGTVAETTEIYDTYLQCVDLIMRLIVDLGGQTPEESASLKIIHSFLTSYRPVSRTPRISDMVINEPFPISSESTPGTLTGEHALDEH